MITKNGRFQCDICGKFVPYRHYYTWTPFGSCIDTEPPDPSYAHIHCYENLNDHMQALTRNLSWIRPYKVDHNEA